MFPFGKILLAMFTVLPSVIFNYFFWIVIFLVGMQYARVAKLQERMLGITSISPMKMTISSLIYGFAGGIIGSFIFILLGVTLTGAGISYVWPLAIFLMLVDVRFLCFSYAGGIVALSNLVFGFPKIGVPELMALVAVLHMIESILIWLGGDENKVPVFLKDKKGQIMGGFALQRFWPVPIVAMMVLPPELAQLQDMARDMIKMPDWWPLIKSTISVPSGHELVYAMFALPAALGYGDIALARMPGERSRITSFHLLLFSLILLCLAVASVKYPLLKYAAAIFSPLGHEAVIQVGRRMEFGRAPLFSQPVRGVRILDVVPGLPASRVGFAPGDIILSINGERVDSSSDIMKVMGDPVPHYYIEAIHRGPDGSEKRVTKILPADIEKLGIVFVPEPDETFYMEVMPDGILKRLIDRIRGGRK